MLEKRVCPGGADGFELTDVNFALAVRLSAPGWRRDTGGQYNGVAAMWARRLWWASDGLTAQISSLSGAGEQDEQTTAPNKVLDFNDGTGGQPLSFEVSTGPSSDGLH
jgi:hypothetical protein